MPGGTFAQQLAGCITEIVPAALDQGSIVWTRSAAIDTFAVALAGSTSAAARLARRVEPCTGGPAPVFGVAERASPTTAAFLNGLAAHVLEYDDYAHDVRGHPSALLFSALLATPGIEDRSGLELIAAYVAGFKVQAWLAKQTGMAQAARGWHVTTTIGTIAAAAACAHVLKLDSEKTAVAVAAATSLASGHRANFGSMCKSLQLGNACRNGLLSALLAREGFTADDDAFEGEQGFFRAYGDLATSAPPPGWMTQPVDFSRAGFRFTPGCGALLAAAQAAARLHPLCPDPHQIAHVEVSSEHEKFSQTDRAVVTSTEAALFSVQHATARALMSGQLTLQSYNTQAVNQPALRELMARVRLIDRPQSAQPMGFGALLRVVLIDGTVLSDHEPGIPHTGFVDLPASTAHQDKFYACATAVLQRETAETLWTQLSRLDRIDRLGPVLSLVTLV